MRAASTLESARRATATAGRAARAAREARRSAILDAQAEGLTLREIAAELGVCHQRVWQIAHTRSDEE